MDFKGYFRCGNRERCDPFTITDAYSRYLIRCQAVPKLDFEHVDAICDGDWGKAGATLLGPEPLPLFPSLDTSGQTCSVDPR